MQKKYLSEYEELVKEIHPIKNGNIDPTIIKRGTGKKLIWICGNGHEWEATVLDRTSRKSGCPYCYGRYATPENNLLVMNPILASELHPTKNTMQANEIKPSSGKKYWWICKNGHEWESTADKRTQGNGCPYCGRRKVSKEVNLKTFHPSIALEWDYHKNKLQPIDVLPKSTKLAWWICPKGHSYEMKICTRTAGGHGCTVCSGHFINEFNCLEKLRPDLLLEWDYIKNKDLNPSQVSALSYLKVWWICSKFQRHGWQASINSRAHGSGCPTCRESKGEKLIEEWLILNNISYKRQFKLDGCVHKKQLLFDFAVFIPELRLIEFNGEQHYRPVPYWGGVESFNRIQLIDAIKENCCKSKNIPLLSIHYKDKLNLKTILESFINI